MKTEAIFLFLILLLGLVLCSFLGGQEGFTGSFTGNVEVKEPASSSGASTASRTQYDTYNHYTKSSTNLTTGAIFYGQKGTTAMVISNPDGTQSLRIVLPGTKSPVVFSPKEPTKESYRNYSGNTTVFYGPNGEKAMVIIVENGQQAIQVTTATGTYYYNVSGRNITSTQYYGSTGNSIQRAPYTMAYDNVNTVKSTETRDNAFTGASKDYYSTLPPGIPKSQIPSGQEDLYILKSQVVPPVCPACPANTTVSSRESCPPCPACARCPEPAFECKKVPNYNAINNDYLPAPILNDFSQFGM